MTPLENALILFLCILSGSLVGVWLYGKQRITELQEALKQNARIDKERLQLTAYERLMILVDRAKLPNLVQRVSQPGLSASAAQQLMLQSLREEYEHNITQQLYVKPELWDAVTRMKEQNAYLIHEVAKTLASDAPAAALGKALLQLHSTHERATLNQTITEAIHYEVNQLLQQL